MNTAVAASLLADSAGQPAWRVLDTQFDPARLFALWQTWSTMARPPRMLHLAVLAAEVPAVDDLLAVSRDAEQTRFAAEMATQWDGLLPGIHRLALAHGRLQLTLCIGDLQTLLREQAFEADSVMLDGQLPWDRWSLKALARCCRRGARLAVLRLQPALEPALRQAGFVVDGQDDRYDPPWTIKTRRTLATPAPVADCVVVGAGLSGASAAAALARRGWNVQVLDSAPIPAAGASGLPAGLLVPHVSSDDSPRSRLSRAGQRLTLHQARSLLIAGEDWAPCGVLERRLDRPAGLPTWWPPDRGDLTQPAMPATASWHADAEPAAELWHPRAAWIKPAALVRAWLRQDGVQFRGLCAVHRMHRTGDLWQLLDRAGQVLAQGRCVVLAAAAESPHLITGIPGLISLPVLQAVRGVMSTGLRRAADEGVLPPFPVNGHGSLIPAVPTHDGPAWYAGATYEDGQGAPLPADEHHRDNLIKLRRLLPATAQALADAFEPGAARGWGNARCVSPDRLPLVGPLEQSDRPTLWLSAAMGSRGLNFAPLCAELLAAGLGGEPLPLEATLAAKLDVARFASK